MPKSPEEVQALMARMRNLDGGRTATTGRAFVRHLSPDQEAALSSALDRFQKAEDTAAKLAVLDDLEEIPHARTLPIVKAALQAGEAEVRQRAFEVISGYDVADVLPLAKQGLSDPDADVRQAAVESLAAVSDPGVSALLIEALRDTEEAVRQAVFGILEDKSADTRQDVYEAGIASPYEDVWDEVVSAITFEPTHDGVYTLLEGLKSSSEDERDRVNDALYFLLSERFDSYAEGRRWWEANRSRFDDEVMEKDEDAEP